MGYSAPSANAIASVGVTATTKTLGLTDANTIQDCNSATAMTVTIPTNAAVPFPINTIIPFEQNGAGSLSVAAASGVTLNGVSQGSVTLGAQNSGLYIRQVSTDNWLAEGGAGTGSFATVSVSGAVLKNAAPAQLTATTSGNIRYSQPDQGTASKEFIGYAAAYVNNTAVNQSITYPVAFINPPAIIANTTGLTLSTTTSALTITAPNSATSYSGNIIVKGA